MIIKSFVRKSRRRINELLGNEPKIRVQLNALTEKHGTDYGGWTILRDSLTEESIVYSFGIGLDISFDECLMRKYGCTIYGYDPTPEVSKWLAATGISGNFIYHPIALAACNKQLRLYKPLNERHISHSIVANRKAAFIEVQAKNISTILKENSHQGIDLLKMDIEGAEYEVIADIIKSKVNIRQLLIEFHHFNSAIKPSDTAHAIKQLNDANFKVFAISDAGLEVSFVKDFALK